MRRRVVLTVALLAAACTSAAKSASPTTTTTAPRPAYTPVYAKVACNNSTDARVECGSLTVPEDRTKQDGRKVVLPVAVVHTADPNPAPDPVLYLSGGPGDSGLKETNRFLMKGQTGNRDVIVFDQRGTGAAEPSLACPEVTNALPQILGAAASFTDEAALGQRALFACRDRLRASGVDLNQYNTAAVADDIADLRVAMGVKEWNLFGVSYGTMDALITMRSHPEGIRSVVLDSVAPPDVGSGAPEVAATYERVKNVLLDGCAKDERCHARYPDLAADLDSVVSTLTATPFTGTATNPVTNQPIPIAITGADVAAGLFLGLYDTDLIPQLPSVIELVRSGPAAAIVIDQLVSQGIDFVSSIAAADAAAVNCFDRAAFIHDGDAARVAAAHPDVTTLLLFSTVSCKDFGVAPAPAGFNDPVTSDIPTLVLLGEYDPVTPPEQSKHAAETLSRSTVVEFPGMGHAEVFAAPECPEVIFRAFLAAPADKVDTSCVASMGPPNWTT